MAQNLDIFDGVESIAIFLMRQEVAVWMVWWEFFRVSESNFVRTSLPDTELFASKDALRTLCKRLRCVSTMEIPHRSIMS